MAGKGNFGRRSQQSDQNLWADEMVVGGVLVCPWNCSA